MDSLTGERAVVPPNLAELLARAQDEALDLPVDDDFIAACQQAGIDPRLGHASFQPDRYWQFAAVYARQRADDKLDGGDEPVATLLSELTLSTPAMILNRQLLGSPQGPGLPRDRARQLVEQVRRHNELIRGLAQSAPNLPASTLAAHLDKAAALLMQPTGAFPDAWRIINFAIRGVQHELAFEQAVSAAGRQLQHATAREDLAGVDYYYYDKSGGRIPVDVKASMNELDGMHGSTSAEPFVIDWERGRVVIFTLLRDRHFGDAFVLPEDLALTVGAALVSCLDQAAYRLRHPRVFRALG